jgi:prepilin-type N-terminal cleavage/methylation domain-containing protein
MKLNNKGFTLIELLVVIVIIGIIAGLVVNVFTDSRRRANAAVVVNSFRQIERSLYLKAIEDGIVNWWHEDFFEACAGTASYSPNPEITSMIENCGLKKYLQSVPDLDIFDHLIYDADGAQFTSCDGSPARGVNVRLDEDVAADQFAAYDEVFDDGDGANCGDLRYDGSNRVHYLLSETLES